MQDGPHAALILHPPIDLTRESLEGPHLATWYFGQKTCLLRLELLKETRLVHLSRAVWKPTHHEKSDFKIAQSTAGSFPGSPNGSGPILTGRPVVGGGKQSRVYL